MPSTILHLACYYGNIQDVKNCFSDTYVDIDENDSTGCTALHISVRLNDLDKVKMLLLNGANPTIRNNNGFSPLQESISSTHPGIIRVLRRYENIYG